MTKRVLTNSNPYVHALMITVKTVCRNIHVTKSKVNLKKSNVLLIVVIRSLTNKVKYIYLYQNI